MTFLQNPSANLLNGMWRGCALLAAGFGVALLCRVTGWNRPDPEGNEYAETAHG